MLTEAINKAVPFLLLPIMTTYLAPSDYGIIATFSAFTGILAIFVHVNMVGAVNVGFFKLERSQLKRYISNVLFISGISATICLLFLFFYNKKFIFLLGIDKKWVFIAVIFVLSQFITNINLVLWQAEQKAKFFCIFQALQTLSYISITLYFIIYIGLKWEGQILAQIMSAALYSLASFIIITRRNYFYLDINKNYIKDILRFGLPLIPHALSAWFRTGVDRFLLNAFVGISATGLYAMGYQFGSIIGILAASFNQAYSPYLFNKLNSIDIQGKKQLVKYTYLYFIVILLIACFFSYFFPIFVNRFINIRYHEANQYIPWIAFGFAFQGMYFMVVNYIFYVKKTHYLSIATFCSGLIHVASSYILIQINGAIGAAQATTFSFFIAFVFVWILSAKAYKMPWRLS
jgi:O-antigen/teichoic acid export membrane protein